MSLLAAACCCGSECISGPTGACCLQYYVPGHTSGYRPYYLFSEFVKEGCTVGCSGCIDNIDECTCNKLVDTLNKEDPIKGFRKFDGLTAHGSVIVRSDWYNTTGVTFTSLFPSICDAVYPATKGNKFNMAAPDPDPTGPTPFLGCGSFCSCEIPSSLCSFTIYGIYTKETVSFTCNPYDGDCCCPQDDSVFWNLIGVGNDWEKFPQVYFSEQNNPDDLGRSINFPNPNYTKKTIDCVQTGCPNGDISYAERYYKLFEINNSSLPYSFKRELVLIGFGTFPVGRCRYEVTINLFIGSNERAASSECASGCDPCCGQQNYVKCTREDGESYRRPCGCCPGSSNTLNDYRTFKIPKYSDRFDRYGSFGQIFSRDDGPSQIYCTPQHYEIDCDGTSPDPIPHTIDY